MLELSTEQVEQLRKQKHLRILIYRFGQLGDTIVALPALWAIRRAFPEASLTYLTSDHPGRGFVLPQEILPREGLIDNWLAYTREGPGKLRGLIQLWKTLRARQFDLLVYLVPRMRPRLSVWRDLAFFRSAGIRLVAGQKGLRSFPSRVPGQPLPSVEHEADHLLHRLALSHIPIPQSNRGNMDLALTSEEKQAAKDWLRSHVPGYSSAVSLVGIGPGSKWPSKIWPVERFEELGGRLITDFSLFPIVFGGPGDVPLTNHLIKHWGKGASAAGVLSVRAAATTLAHCRLFVGNDTGTMHLAAAVRTPCVGIFAAQNWPGRWHPYGPGHIVLRRSVPCEGCGLEVCTKEGMRCLKEISVEDALQACRTVLRGQTS
jgi:heptosyltransferase-3